MGRKKWKYSTYEIVNGKRVPTKCYQLWSNMMRRCYDVKCQERQPTYIGCSVSDEWLDYDVFYVWFQDNYREEFALDKDILIQGNKVYGPNTCVFVPSYINSLLIKRDASRGEHPIGVSFKTQNNKYIAHLNINGKTKHLGYFTDPIEAHKAYCNAKYQYIRETAENALKIGDIDERVYEALLNYKISMY